AVDAGDASRGGAVAGEDLLQRVRDLADGGASACRFDGERQQIPLAARGGLGERLERRAPATLVARLADLLQPRDLLLAQARVVDIEQFGRLRVLRGLIFVDADDHLLATVDAGLALGRGLLDAQLRHAGLDGLGHAAERLDLVDQLLRFVGQARRQRL